MEKLEIERRFLLSGIPTFLSNPTFEIYQFYGTDEFPFRVRSRMICDTKEFQYFLTRKTYISLGTCIENESEITLQEFEYFRKLSTKVIRKNRYEYKVGSLLFEIDELLDRLFIFLEVELESIDQIFEMPKELIPFIIKEITENKELSNSSLANIIQST